MISPVPQRVSPYSRQHHHPTYSPGAQSLVGRMSPYGGGLISLARGSDDTDSTDTDTGGDDDDDAASISVRVASSDTLMMTPSRQYLRRSPPPQQRQSGATGGQQSGAATRGRGGGGGGDAGVSPVHPRVKTAKRAIKLVRRMERITRSRAFERAMGLRGSDMFESSDDDADSAARGGDGGGGGGCDPQGAPMLTQAQALRMAHGLEHLDGAAAADSDFSSEKLCKAFTATSRIAAAIASATDDIIETVLEQRSPAWLHADISADVRDCVHNAALLRRQCDALLECAARFCGAAERVLHGADAEVACVRAEVRDTVTRADALHAAAQERKSPIEKLAKEAADLVAANAARALCLRRARVEEAAAAAAAVDEASSRRRAASGGMSIATSHHRNSATPPVLTLSPAPAHDADVRARLRMVLSAAVMQIRGQRSAMQQVADVEKPASKDAAVASSAYTARVLHALDVVLGTLA